LIYTFFAGFIIVNVFMMLMGLFGARYFAAVLKAPKAVVGTLICFFSIFGTYAVNTTTFDLWVMFGAMFFGFLLAAINMPILPVVLGFILGTTLEQNLVVTVRIVDGVLGFLERPIAAGFVALAVLILAHSIWRRATSYLGARNARTGSEPISPAVQPD
jgi:putative tricarboxylic transport membrane protein